jgi:hypothetical protein
VEPSPVVASFFTFLALAEKELTGLASLVTGVMPVRLRQYAGHGCVVTMIWPECLSVIVSQERLSTHLNTNG